MDAFSYLSVMLSIVLGLALQQVLMGYRGLLLSRARVKLYWPPLAWSALIILLVAQNWWASFGLVDHRDWSFDAFMVILLQVGLLYMMAGVVLPDIPAGEAIDLKAHFFREHRWLFGLGAAVVAVSALRDVIVEGSLPEPANLAFHGVFFAASVVAAIVQRPRYHEIMTVVMGTVIVSYVLLLFAKLA